MLRKKHFPHCKINKDFQNHEILVHKKNQPVAFYDRLTELYGKLYFRIS